MLFNYCRKVLDMIRKELVFVAWTTKVHPTGFEPARTKCSEHLKCSALDHSATDAPSATVKSHRSTQYRTTSHLTVFSLPFAPPTTLSTSIMLLLQVFNKLLNDLLIDGLRPPTPSYHYFLRNNQSITAKYLHLIPSYTGVNNEVNLHPFANFTHCNSCKCIHLITPQNK
jgi:hypothetical protein